MKKVKLSKEEIRKIINESTGISECILKLYEHVTGDDWHKIEKFNSFPACNHNTALFIMETMHKKWDPVRTNLIWLQNGFSSKSMGTPLKDFIVEIPNNCYILMEVKSMTVDQIIDMTAGYAQQEVEEFFKDNDNENQIL